MSEKNYENRFKNINEITNESEKGERPLEGIRVLSFAYIHAGGLATGILSQLGAEVIKIESKERLDWVRLAYPRPENAEDDDLEKCGMYMRLNFGKKDIKLNMSSDRSDEVLSKLIKKSDVVVENFSATGMKRLGWPYKRISEVNEDVIYLSMASYGHKGAKSKYLGYGSTIDAPTGLLYHNGYPDEHPTNHQTSYPDSISGVTGAYAVLSALIAREQDGEGQHIDLDQVEATTSLNGSSILQASVNGEERSVYGNWNKNYAPHGVYPCCGDDEWCAIAVRSKKEWDRFCNVVKNPELKENNLFSTNEKRLQNRDNLDEFISEWTSEYNKYDLMKELQKHNVASGVVQKQEDIINKDNHLVSRDALQLVKHDGVGNLPFQALPYKFSQTYSHIPDPSPKFGEHTEEIMRELLGYTNKEIEELIEEEVLV
jgi:benzylsuccinate CoA-transferase BbsF subunit